jgi:hypothetical protein
LAGARAELRREQVRILLVAVPVLVAAYLLVGGAGSAFDRRLVAAVVLLPLSVVLVALGLPLVRDRRLVLGGGFLRFFVVYCLFFSVAAGTRVLEGKRTVVAGFEDDTPSNVLGLSRLGDWHYAVAPSAPAANDLMVITLPSFGGRSVNDARQAEIALIAMAVTQKAKGIAFDYDMSDSSRLDRALCFWIQRAESAGVPVVLGYVLDKANDTPVRRLPAREIAACVANERLGTLAGVRESDGRVRMVPTSHLGNDALRSFSYRIASILAPGKALPDVGLTQFVAPAAPITTLASVPNDSTDRLMDGRFVIVGSERLGDVHATPYGSLPGVLIHAYAANALRYDRVIRRLDVRWVLPGILLVCYVLILLQSYGGLRPLLVGAALISVAIVLSGAFAMRMRLVWVDVSYPLLAVGALTAVLSGGARLRWARVRTPRAPESRLDAARPNAETPARFDVFLSHNSVDKPTVIELATILRDRNLNVWLDAWELVPGKPWQQAIEDVIETVGSAAVLVGKDGIGPWEAPEMRACLDECVRRRMSVIPVLLPGASATPALPLFLRQFTWVDFRDGLDEAKVDRLEWGITGIKPRKTPIASVAPSTE